MKLNKTVSQYNKVESNRAVKGINHKCNISVSKNAPIQVTKFHKSGYRDYRVASYKSENVNEMLRDMGLLAVDSMLLKKAFDKKRLGFGDDALNELNSRMYTNYLKKWHINDMDVDGKSTDMVHHNCIKEIIEPEHLCANSEEEALEKLKNHTPLKDLNLKVKSEDLKYEGSIS